MLKNKGKGDYELKGNQHKDDIHAQKQKDLFKVEFFKLNFSGKTLLPNSPEDIAPHLSTIPRCNAV